MKLFNCPTCGNIVYFENRACAACQSRLGYLPHETTMAAWREGGAPPQRPCAALDACNWFADRGEEYCIACRHNGTVPDLRDADHLRGWQELKAAKHRLFYSLQR